MEKELKKAKILVVDDEPEIVNTLKLFFSGKGYDVIGSSRADEVMGILEKEKADVVLLDLIMPGLSGAELARIIREKYPEIKIIVITAHPSEGEKVSDEAKLDGFLVKPVGMHDLYSKLASVLGHDDMPAADTSAPKEGIKARLLLIKAKLLFVEPSPKIFDFLSFHFKGLANKGENYEVDAAYNEAETLAKLNGFKPDLMVMNLSYMKGLKENFLQKISDAPDKPKEIIIYNLSDAQVIDQKEVSRLTKTVQAFCLKNGLIEVKWVEI